MDYINTKEKFKAEPTAITKPKLQCELNDYEVSQTRIAAGNLAWIATGTLPSSACLANMALQVQSKIVALLHSGREAYAPILLEKLANLRCVPLDFGTVHIGVFYDGSFQNLPAKQSQVGFVFLLADGDNNFNLFHWQSGRDTGQSHRQWKPNCWRSISLSFVFATDIA